jgi:hypothetical protein
LNCEWSQLSQSCEVSQLHGARSIEKYQLPSALADGKS